MPRYELHVGSAAFWRRAQADIAKARRRVLIQAMTFEGDVAGLAVAKAVAESPASDRRVLVDDYTRHVINDSFLAFARDPALTAEADATWRMFERLRRAGVGVRVSNPIGFNPLRYAARNHKKLLVMDDVAWLGGINFSDHNFAWHDMMVRVDGAEVADWLVEAFGRDWGGEPNHAQAHFDGELHLASVDGSANAAGFAPVLEAFGKARRSVEMISAYPTFPFVDTLAAAAARGVAVTIYTPAPNNKPIVRDYLLRAAARSGIAIRLLPEMTHVKAALVDGTVLIVGSSNFDFVSYRTSAEYLATIRDAGLIAACEAELFAPARAAAVPALPGGRAAGRGWRAAIALHGADSLIRWLKPGRRTAEWSRPDRRSRLAEPNGHG